MLSEAIFFAQMDKFSNNKLGNDQVQLVFEEAHNLFGAGGTDKARAIYRRLAKEGAKFHIGICYSTQSVSSIDDALLEQTENWFIFHMSSRDQVKALGKVETAYESIGEDIRNTRTPGCVRMLARSHCFVISVQVRLFRPPAKASAKWHGAPDQWHRPPEWAGGLSDALPAQFVAAGRARQPLGAFAGAGEPAGGTHSAELQVPGAAAGPGQRHVAAAAGRR